jgi:hypothetical protein
MIVGAIIILLSFKDGKNKKNSNIHDVRMFKNADRLVANQTYIVNTKATTPYTCETLLDDTVDCVDKYDAVSTAGATWGDGAAITTAVNNYITECKTSKCKTGCPALASAKDLGSELNTYVAAFEVTCRPKSLETTNEITTAQCTPLIADTTTVCATAYTAVITATTVTSDLPWDAVGVKAAIDDFIVKCGTTKCKETCKTVISKKDVGTEVANLKSSFTSSCNPSSSGGTGGGGSGSGSGSIGFMAMKTSSSLIILFICGMIIQLMNFE